MATNVYSLIKASAGSGKTTRVPPELLKITDKKILILEPRRLAAKMQARRIAEEMESTIGENVGYLFKGERCLQESTRLLFITEGMLSRFLEKDYLLEEFSFIILDEFHERHLETDLAFYHLQKVNQKRLAASLPPLHLVFMSATLNTELLKTKLGSLAEFNVEIPPFERQTHFLPNIPSILNAPLSLKIKNTILATNQNSLIGILVFVPGKREIAETLSTLQKESTLLSQYEFAILHGELTKEEQQDALLPPVKLKKKIVIATNIAESSITIPYVNAVIDSGLEREYQGHVVTGFGKLHTRKIDRASAEQRAGRANRTGPGVVYRLYSQLDFEQREAFKSPAIMRNPMMEPIISIIKNHQVFEDDLFLENPPPFHLEMGFKQLQFLDILANKSLTAKGYSIDQSLGLRLSLIAHAYQTTENISIKDLTRTLDDFLDFETKKDFEKALLNIKKTPSINKRITDIDELILHGFLDLVGSINVDRKIILQNGENFLLHPKVEETHGKLKAGTLALILSMSANEEVTAILPLEIDSIMQFTEFLTTENHISLVSNGKRKITTKTKLGLLTLVETYLYEEQNTSDRKIQHKKLLTQLVEDFFNDTNFIRYRFFQHFFATNNGQIFDANLLIEVYLLEWEDLHKIERFQQEEFLRELKEEYLLYIDAKNATHFDIFFPQKMRFTDRRETPLHYEIHGEEYMVFVESFMQDFYGLSDGPKIADGKLPLTFRLLGPHKRALQVTQDLKNFWHKTYKEIHRELTREYPRHHWPEDPSCAPPVLLKRMLS